MDLGDFLDREVIPLSSTSWKRLPLVWLQAQGQSVGGDRSELCRRQAHAWASRSYASRRANVGKTTFAVPLEDEERGCRRLQGACARGIETTGEGEGLNMARARARSRSTRCCP